MTIPETHKGRRLRWCWPYFDEAGDPLNFQVVRFDATDNPGDKICVPFRPNGTGWKAGALPEPRPLYGLNWLPAARERGSAVLVVEGEKAAAALHSLGFVAVTSQGGASSARTGDWKPLSGFAKAYVMPDRNEPGKRYARDVCALLAALPEPPELFVVELPDRPPGGDVVDWIQARLPNWDGFTAIDAELVDELADELKAAIKAASRPPPPDWTGGEAWPDPQPLPDARPPVLAFDESLLPDVLRPWVLDIAERMQCPPDYPAACVMVAAGSLIGRRLGIRPKARDDWLIVPNLWGAIVGPPGSLKTPAMDEALRPVRRLAAEARQQFEQAMQTFRVDKHRRDAERYRTKAAMRRAKAADDLDTMAADLARMDAEDDLPPERRYITNDGTVEKLAELLADNPAGILNERDELTGWLRDLDRPGRESSRAFFLEAWNGIGGFTVDRIGRGTIRVPALCVSVLGTIQPGPLADYVYGALTEGGGADGLLQRFQVLVWPDEPPGWRDVDRWPDSTARNAAFEAFAGLAGLEPLAIGAQAPDDNRGIPCLRFDDAAQALFREWRTGLEHRIKREGSEALQGHLAKYRKLCPALALVAHLLDVGAGPVGERAMLQAAGWCEYLESHARRLYGASVAPEATAARLLAAKLSELPDPFTAKQVYDRGWSGLDRERVELAVSELSDPERGWLRMEKAGTGARGGRPSVRFRINPKCRGLL